MSKIKASIKIILGKILTMLISFIALIIFSNELGADVLGIYYSFIAILNFFAVIANLGIRTAAEKRISENHEQRAYLGASLIIKIVLLSLISILIWFFSEYINAFIGEELALLLIITLILNEISLFGIAITRGEHRVGETAIIRVLRPLGWLIVGYSFYIMGWGVQALVYGYITGLIGMSILAWWKVSILPAVPTRAHVQSVINYGKFSTISSLSSYLYGWVDVIVLTAFAASSAVVTRGEIGVYENTWRISILFAVVSRSISEVIFPEISSLDESNSKDRIEKLIQRAILPGLLTVFPGVIAALVISKDILRFLFGSEFLIGWLSLIILVGGKLFQSTQTIFGQVLEAIDRPDVVAYSLIIGGVNNVILNVIFVYYLGFTGAAMATVISVMITVSLQAYYISDRMCLSLPWQDIVWGGTSAVMMGIVIYFIKITIGINSRLYLVSTVITGGVIYTLALFCKKGIRDKTQTIYRMVAPW